MFVFLSRYVQSSSMFVFYIDASSCHLCFFLIRYVRTHDNVNRDIIHCIWMEEYYNRMDDICEGEREWETGMRNGLNYSLSKLSL